MALSLKPVALALLLGQGCAGAASAASTAELADMLDRLGQRVQRLEQINADLQRQLDASRVGASAQPVATAAEQRLQVLEKQQAILESSLQADTLSDKEPELSARLKALEARTQEMAGPVGKIKALEGVKAGVSLTMVAQKSYAPGVSDSQLNYRGDAFVGLPLDSIGDVDQQVYAQFRMGSGVGLSGLPSYSKPNASAFELLGGFRSEDSVALLAQAWYQARIPLPLGGFKPDSKHTLEVTVGKMDPFANFDQNTVAGDETRQFLNSVFVHNPMLDTGGDIGVDGNGFTPGLRVSLHDATEKLESWRLSLGVLGAGSAGANYQRSFGAPLVMLQAETAKRLMGGLLGNYRIYTWRNPQGVHFDTTITMPEVHSGWGVSMDQRVGDGMTLFARYGQETSGNVRFDRALTLGADFNGSYWNRGGDTVGLGLGWLRTSDAYRDFTAPTTAISGTERIAELYYRYRISKQFELSPSLQYIGNPGGDPAAPDVRLLGLRSQFTF